jgi:hypothetical protein
VRLPDERVGVDERAEHRFDTAVVRHVLSGVD